MIRFLVLALCCIPVVGVIGDEQEKPQRPKNSAPLEFMKWSGDVNVPDPVAISFDNEGRAYVTQTQRRKVQDLDIRQRTFGSIGTGFPTTSGCNPWTTNERSIATSWRWGTTRVTRNISRTSTAMAITTFAT
ncbi:MAG: hypothetical protein ABGZ53_16255 [Fuerstiella sp.]